MKNPIEIFNANWQKARASGEGNANYCFLATPCVNSNENADTGVSVRTLVLREVVDDAFLLFINESSPKWRELQAVKSCELLIFWPSMMQQYKVRGEVVVLDEATMRTHWAKKPYEAKILDHFYQQYLPQSSAIASRQELLNGIKKLQDKYPQTIDIPFPSNAKGIAIQASVMELWFGSEQDRIHERTLYIKDGADWESAVLVP